MAPNGVQKTAATCRCFVLGIRVALEGSFYPPRAVPSLKHTLHSNDQVANHAMATPNQPPQITAPQPTDKPFATIPAHEVCKLIPLEGKFAGLSHRKPLL